MDAMDERALLMFEDEELRPRAMAHIIHSMMAPRISDVAAFQWDYFDFQTMTIQFRARKTRSDASSTFSQTLFRPFNNTSLGFHSSRRRGVPLPHQHPKRFWNHETRQSARNGQNHSQVVEANQRLNDGQRRTVQPLSSHSYRRSLAMRYLASGSTFENIAMVLGDEIGTLEKYYAELDTQRFTANGV